MGDGSVEVVLPSVVEIRRKGGRHTRPRWNRARVRPTRSAADDNTARQYAMAAVWLDRGGSAAPIVGGLMTSRSHTLAIGSRGVCWR